MKKKNGRIQRRTERNHEGESDEEQVLMWFSLSRFSTMPPRGSGGTE